MAIADVTKPMALDETLQATNTALGLLGKDTTLQAIVTALGNIGINTVGNLTSLVTTDKSSLVNAINEVAGEMDDLGTDKADKVTGATADNLAGLNGSGNLTDSGWNGAKDTTSISGNPISIPNLKLNQLAVNPIITLEPIQAGSGTPSPSNIRAISGYDKIEVLSCGKNIFDKSKVELGAIDQTTGEDIPSTTVYRTKGFIRVKSATEYRFEGFNEDLRVFLYSDAELISSSVQSARYSIIFPANVTRIRMQSSMFNNFKDTLQIEQSASYTDYSPYNKITDISESLGQTVYGATLDVRTGVLTVTWGYIASYAGESLPGEWISDRNAYAAGTSPSTGTQVAYKLASANYTEIQLTPHEINLLKDYAYVSTNGTTIALDYHNGELASLGDVSQLGETVNELGEYIKNPQELFTYTFNGNTTWQSALYDIAQRIKNMSWYEMQRLRLVYDTDNRTFRNVKFATSEWQFSGTCIDGTEYVDTFILKVNSLTLSSNTMILVRITSSASMTYTNHSQSKPDNGVTLKLYIE